MTIKNKTPTARAAARSYCRRCLAVMLCCVLVSGMTVPAAPRAKAVIPEVAIAGMADGVAMGGGLAGGPVGSVLGMLVGSACGLKVQSGSTSGIVGMTPAQYVYSSRGYDYGGELAQHLRSLGGQIAEWWDGLVSRFEAKGGVAEGDTFEIPPEVAAAVKAWTVSHYDFTGGIVSYQDHLLFHDGHTFVLSDLDTSKLDDYNSSYSKAFSLPVLHPGSLIGFPDMDFSQSDDYSTVIYLQFGIGIQLGFHISFSDSKWSGVLTTRSNIYDGRILSDFGNSNLNGVSTSSSVSRDVVVETLRNYCETDFRRIVLFNSSVRDRLYVGVYDPVGLSVNVNSRNYYEFSESLPTVDSSVAATPELEAQRDDPISVVVPTPAGVADVGGYATPVFDELSPSVLTPGLDVPGTDVDTPAVPGITAGEITGAIEAALPVTGAVAGDAVVGEALAEPDSLGAVFTSKFPFSIPWDVGRAIKLLAAPPVTPRWELDFMAPIAYRVGGFKGDTTVVLDFSDYEIIGQVTRWVSTLMFVYALATGTKRLIWTA